MKDDIDIMIADSIGFDEEYTLPSKKDPAHRNNTTTAVKLQPNAIDDDDVVDLTLDFTASTPDNTPPKNVPFKQAQSSKSSFKDPDNEDFPIDFMMDDEPGMLTNY